MPSWFTQHRKHHCLLSPLSKNKVRIRRGYGLRRHILITEILEHRAGLFCIFIEPFFQIIRCFFYFALFLLHRDCQVSVKCALSKLKTPNRSGIFFFCGMPPTRHLSVRAARLLCHVPPFGLRNGVNFPALADQTSCIVRRAFLVYATS